MCVVCVLPAVSVSLLVRLPMVCFRLLFLAFLFAPVLLCTLLFVFGLCIYLFIFFCIFWILDLMFCGFRLLFLEFVRLCLVFLCILTKVFSTFPFFQLTENAIPNSYYILFWLTLIYVTEMVLLCVIHFIGDNILVSINLMIANFRCSGHGKNTKYTLADIQRNICLGNLP